MTLRWIPWSLLVAMAGVAGAQQEGPDALSRIFKHNNGQRTETQKMGGANEIRESVFDQNNILCGVRVFRLNAKGQILNGVIYDGKKNPVGSTRNNFDPQSGQMVMEELFNREGKKVRELWYPGSLKDQRFAKRMVAFNFDPTNPKAAPKEVAGTVRPIVPVTKNEDEFEPGLPQGTAAPTVQEGARRERASSGPAPKTLPKRSWFPQKAQGK